MAAPTGSDSTAALQVPGIYWQAANPDSVFPKGVMYENGVLSNDKVYIGRVHDGKNLYIGTVIPVKGVCIYLDKDRELKKSSSYEVLSVEQMHSTMFLDLSEVDTLQDLFSREDLLTAGIDEGGEILYVVRHVDKDYNFYYGWISKSRKEAYIPRDSKSGKQVLDSDFGILTHMSLNDPMICICPPGPVPQE